jgi:hypothetical protein
MKRILAAGIVLAALSSATALASADAAPTHHATPSAKAGAFQVTAGVNKTETEVGRKVKIKGSVKPAASGAGVTLQVRYEGQSSWKTIGHALLSRTSKFKFKDKVGSVRDRKYRVLKPAGPNRAAGHSPSLKVTVFGWRDLTSFEPATATNMSETSFVDINGVRYPNSLRSYYFGSQSPTVSIEYNLNRDCKSLRGTIGLDDHSPTGSSALLGFATDGTPRWSGSVGLGQSVPVAFDVTNVFRLTISAVNSGNGIGAVGTPQVLCNF